MELHDSRHALSRAVPPAADHGAALRVRVPVERVYDAHFDYVLSNLRRLGVDDHELEDAAQDVFLIVLRRREAFEGRSSVRSWIFGITRRVAWRYRRSAQRTLRRRAVLAREPREQPVGLDGALAEHQAQELLRAFLDSLKRPQREAFILGELEGLQRRELGRALGVSPNTAYSRLRLARARFAATFENSVRRDMLLQRWRARQREPAREQRVWLALSPLLTPLAKAGPLTWLSGQSGWTLGKLLAGVSLVGVVALALPSARRSAADASAASKEVDVGADARTRGGHGDAARSDGPEPATGDSAWAHSPFTLFEDDDERGASRDRRPARRRAPAATATRSSSPSP
ncbi:MAG: sigma-70 family RNA polymerase sigma factor, partial [Myxococcales bacterium]|nr:sigma-70 family RNA polymerase sigma factor [Myxococcales bacterium]